MCGGSDKQEENNVRKRFHKIWYFVFFYLAWEKDTSRRSVSDPKPTIIVFAEYLFGANRLMIQSNTGRGI
jgi:hypothetical protein